MVEAQAVDIWVVGAGMAGASAAHHLAAAGWTVAVLDKARGLGGRLAVRRCGSFHYDLGATYWTCRSEAFRAQVDVWRDEGWVSPLRRPFRVYTVGHGWSWPCAPSYVRFSASSGSNRAVHALLQGIEVRTQSQVVRVKGSAGGWCLELAGGKQLGARCGVILTAPWEQSRTWTEGQAPSPAPVALLPGWSVGLRLAPSGLACDGILVNGGRVRFVRVYEPVDGVERWMVQIAGRSGSGAVADDPLEVVRMMLAELAEWHPEVQHADIEVVHRWRYAALAETPSSEGRLFGVMPESAEGLVWAGDQWSDGRVEGAFLSGRAAACHLDAVLRGRGELPSCAAEGELKRCNA